MFSAVELLLELTIVEGRALLGPHQFCVDVPRIVPSQEKSTHKQLNSSLARRHCYLQLFGMMSLLFAAVWQDVTVIYRCLARRHCYLQLFGKASLLFTTVWQDVTVIYSCLARRHCHLQQKTRLAQKTFER
jgi:hypothetical protein